MHYNVSMKRDHSIQSGVADYYDINTLHFLKSKKSRLVGAIHRRLYPPGIKKKAEAAIYSNHLILEIIKERRAERILDLGCGVGGTMRYLKDRYPADYRGTTISQVQRNLAIALETEIEVADFQDSEWFEKQNPFDVVFALESLQHNPDHQNLARNILKLCKPGTIFIVVDDFLFHAESSLPRKMKLIKRFKKHWYAHGYTGTNEFISVYENEGFILKERQDLSGYMKKNPVTTFLVGLFSRFILFSSLKSPALDNIIGGNALKQLQQMRCSGYFKIVFEYKKKTVNDSFQNRAEYISI